MQFLVTGGAGYIGSHAVKALLQHGHNVVILDNFSTGHLWATQGQEVLDIDLKDIDILRTRLNGRKFDGIFHFAAKSLVRESNQDPVNYYINNVGGTANLIQLALENGWTKCVFSSTAAIYGNPISDSINEGHPKAPINVYGQTKLVMEQLIESTCISKPFSAVCLRYFNAAGASNDATIGEFHNPETHLIPNILRAAKGAGELFTIFGDDYPTQDGTCVRDYIHVEDLADAHLKAMEFIQKKSGFFAFNLGNERGFSIKQVLNACQEVIGGKIPYKIGHRREGDPALLIADASRAKEILGWVPYQTDILDIVASAWNWEKKLDSF